MRARVCFLLLALAFSPAMAAGIGYFSPDMDARVPEFEATVLACVAVLGAGLATRRRQAST